MQFTLVFPALAQFGGENPATHIVTYRRAPNGAWVPETKINFRYDTNDSLISNENMSWDSDKLLWKAYLRVEYLRDEKGRLNERSGYNWMGDSLEWVMRTYEKITRNDAGYPLTRLDVLYGPGTEPQSFILSNLSEWTYDAQNRISTHVRSFEHVRLDPTRNRTEYTYDAENRIKEQYFSSWDFYFQQWQLIQRQERVYSDTSQTVWVFLPDGSGWKPGGYYRTSQDPNGRPFRSISESDVPTGQDNYWVYRYDFEGDSSMEKILYRRFNDTAPWTPVKRELLTRIPEGSNFRWFSTDCTWDTSLLQLDDKWLCRSFWYVTDAAGRLVSSQEEQEFVQNGERVSYLSPVSYTTYDLYCDGLIKNTFQGESLRTDYAYRYPSGCAAFEGALQVYPNPGTGMITLEGVLLEAGDINLEVLDLAGRRITFLPLFRSAYAQVDVSSLVPGMYYLVLNQGKKRLSATFMKN
ncbi:MAG: T9SS type A sorting domain-containing protein [Saprospiraceae bacterium]|nr:T9SS type A sorting domain-containing protein [Saprospiraceae bacterium]